MPRQNSKGSWCRSRNNPINHCLPGCIRRYPGNISRSFFIPLDGNHNYGLVGTGLCYHTGHHPLPVRDRAVLPRSPARCGRVSPEHHPAADADARAGDGGRRTGNGGCPVQHRDNRHHGRARERRHPLLCGIPGDHLWRKPRHHAHLPARCPEPDRLCTDLHPHRLCHRDHPGQVPDLRPADLLLRPGLLLPCPHLQRNGTLPYRSRS